MFFKSKKKQAEKLELLYKKNIKVNCHPASQEEVIRQVGQMLVESGYVDQPYVEGMIKREASFSTYMGNGLALPHGVEEAKREIKATGIAIMVFPEGTPWGEEMAHIVIGIAGVGEEHLNILATIADKMLSEDAASEIMNGNEEQIYRLLTN